MLLDNSVEYFIIKKCSEKALIETADSPVSLHFSPQRARSTRRKIKNLCELSDEKNTSRRGVMKEGVGDIYQKETKYHRGQLPPGG